MTAAAQIGAVIAAEIAAAGIPATLRITTTPGTYANGRRSGGISADFPVSALLTKVRLEWDGTTRRYVGSAVIGPLPAGTPAPKMRDAIQIGDRTWAITGAKLLSDGLATYAWSFDLEAVA